MQHIKSNFSKKIRLKDHLGIFSNCRKTARGLFVNDSDKEVLETEKTASFYLLYWGHMNFPFQSWRFSPQLTFAPPLLGDFTPSMMNINHKQRTEF